MLHFEKGMRFNRLVLISFAYKKNEVSHWTARCDCGTIKAYSVYKMRSGHTQSCGCLHKERIRTHNQTKTNLYYRYHAILHRCNNPDNIYYKNYGGRGIKCLWETFEEFANDMGQPPTPKHTLDRIDNDGHYCKENCRWATRFEQSINTRQNRLITHDGKTQCLALWAKEYGMTPNMLRGRLQSGWTMENALTKKPRSRGFNRRGVFVRAADFPNSQRRISEPTPTP